ncbi:MAG: UDP-glucose 4-epimerase [Pseudonocardiales bacterium]|nr:UDP-glucose 4-epimerase [Pseudonocardiales bacterium]
MRYLVSGGAGYIGSVVTSELVTAGHEVTVLDDLTTGHADAVAPGATLVVGNIVDIGDLLAEGSYDGVLHFAAKSLVSESVIDPAIYWHNNVVGTLAIIDAVRAHGVPRLVFSSTAATYGEPDEVPITEESETRPTNPYGASKLTVDMALTSYANAYGLAAVSLRYFNVAGSSGAYGERHVVETHLIPITLQVAAGTRESLNVYGDDYPTFDGTCVRDYVHVLDLTDAHVRALAACEPGQHKIINLGSGRGYSVQEVVETVRRVTGRPIATTVSPRRTGDPAVLIASNDVAKAILGWEPERDLTEMVTDAWAFAQRSIDPPS